MCILNYFLNSLVEVCRLLMTVNSIERRKKPKISNNCSVVRFRSYTHHTTQTIPFAEGSILRLELMKLTFTFEIQMQNIESQKNKLLLCYGIGSSILLPQSFYVFQANEYWKHDVEFWCLHMSFFSIETKAHFYQYFILAPAAFGEKQMVSWTKHPIWNGIGIIFLSPFFVLFYVCVISYLSWTHKWFSSSSIRILFFWFRKKNCFVLRSVFFLRNHCVDGSNERDEGRNFVVLAWTTKLKRKKKTKTDERNWKEEKQLARQQCKHEHQFESNVIKEYHTCHACLASARPRDVPYKCSNMLFSFRFILIPCANWCRYIF